MQDQASNPAPANADAAENRSTIGSYLKANLREYGLLLALIVVMASFQIMTDGILMKPLNITNLVLQNSYIVIMAVGMLLVIVSGNIDLSVGSVVGFIGALAAVLMVSLELNPSSLGRNLPDHRRGHRRRAGLLGGLSQDPVLHRDAGRDAGVPRA